MVVENAVKAGADFFEGMEAISPLDKSSIGIEGALALDHSSDENIIFKAKFMRLLMEQTLDLVDH